MPCPLHAGFLLYCLAATAVILYLIVKVAPAHGNSNIFVYLAICSLIGSLSVMSVKVGEMRHQPASQHAPPLLPSAADALRC